MPLIGEINVENVYERIDIYEDSNIEWKIPDFLDTVASTRDAYLDSKVFKVGSCPFFLRLFPKTARSPNKDEFSIVLKSNVTRDFNVAYNFGLKKRDNIVENISNGKMKCNQKYGRGKLILPIQDIEIKKSSLIHGSFLIIMCKLMPSILLSSKSHKKKLWKLDVLSDNLKHLMLDSVSHDTTLKVEGKEFKVHRVILESRSSVFENVFKHNSLETKTGVVIIPDCSKESFPFFIEYLYTGKIVGNLDINSALNLYYIAEKYDVKELKTFCVEFLIEEVDVNHFIEICVFADKFQVNELLEKMQDFFNANSAKIFVLREWMNLMKYYSNIANNLLINMKK